MTNAEYTHLGIIVDRSGSMAGVAADMVGGLNEFIKNQAEQEGKTLITYVQFDDRYDVVHDGVPADYVKAVIEPRGMTALLDAVGRTVTNLGTKFRNMRESERPGKVLIVVVTDGHENASKEYTSDQIAKMIATQEDKYQWEFVFLGANMDAVAVGQQFGFKPEGSLTFNIHNKGAIGNTSAVLAGYANTYRGGGKANFSDEDRLAASVTD